MARGDGLQGSPRCMGLEAVRSHALGNRAFRQKRHQTDLECPSAATEWFAVGHEGCTNSRTEENAEYMLCVLDDAGAHFTHQRQYRIALEQDRATRPSPKFIPKPPTVEASDVCGVQNTITVRVDEARYSYDNRLRRDGSFRDDILDHQRECPNGVAGSECIRRKELAEIQRLTVAGITEFDVCPANIDHQNGLTDRCLQIFH
ncbi:hypothetical protein PTKU15_50180 [Paraburkholderia terrae]|nr:hypothetical protein PTKU15_50180 [Paraburkholderia terrae]